MRKGWFTRFIESFADAGSLVGMPPAAIELMILEERERLAAEAAERLAAEADQGTSNTQRVPAAA